jgi:hypothetical protein
VGYSRRSVSRFGLEIEAGACKSSATRSESIS